MEHPRNERRSGFQIIVRGSYVEANFEFPRARAFLRTECTYVLYSTLLNVPVLYIFKSAASCLLFSLLPSYAFWIHQSPSLMRSYVSDPTLMCDGCAIQDLLKLICVNFKLQRYHTYKVSGTLLRSDYHYRNLSL